MCLSLCAPWLTPLCLVLFMSSSHVTASWSAGAWKQARGSLACVLMILRKGTLAGTQPLIHLNKPKPQNEVLELKLSLRPQVRRLRLHADHQERPFSSRRSIGRRHCRRKTLPGHDQGNEGRLQYRRHRAFRGHQSKNHSNKVMLRLKAFSRYAVVNSSGSFRWRTVRSKRDYKNFTMQCMTRPVSGSRTSRFASTTRSCSILDQCQNAKPTSR